MEKVKKSKFRKRINRLKNFLRYARKRCAIHVLPVVCGCSVVLVTLFTSYQNTYATGLEEAFYYTYLDLMSGLYAQTGYELSFKDEYYTKPERASAKDVWDNFCTWVERKAQVLSLPVRIVNDTVFNELQNLPNVVTQAGATMSEELSELLATVLPTTAYDDMVNQFDTSSIESINKVVSTLTGGGYLSQKQAESIMNGEALLNIVYDPSNGRYMAYALSLTYGIVDDYKIDDPREDFLSLFVIDSTGKSEFCSIYGSVIRGSKTMLDMSCYTAKPDMVWVVKNGAFMANDSIGAQVSAGACPKEVPDVSPWIKNPAIPDEWRIVRPGETPNPDEDPDDNPDVLPFVIPIHPPTIDPDPDPDPDPKPDGKDDKEKDTETDIVPPIPHPDTDIDPVPPPDNTEDNTEDDDDIDPDPVPAITSKYGDITKLFPFCIPFDLVKLIKGLSAKKAPPVFHFEYKFKAIHYNFVVDVDLSDYEKYIKIFRYGMQIFYVIALMFMTVRLSELFS